METKKALSASSIKSIETCSWMYWQQYEQKVPQKTNEGALRGTIVHLIFELLLHKRHRKHYDSIMRHHNVSGSPAIRRLLIKQLGAAGILSVNNYNLCNDMILVGLKTDFFGQDSGKGIKLGEPEFRFELENKSPEYKVRGYIDKLIFYPDGKIKIVDYKTSKSKFSGDDLEANVQSMVYSLTGYKIFGADDVVTQFIFLRYPRQPIQEVHLTKAQLRGFEEYLAYMYKLVNSFNEKKAQSNMAAHSEKNKWLCKAGATWECPYMRPFDYWALLDKDGKVARTALKKEDLKPTSEQTLVSLSYAGCPAFAGISAPDEM